VIEELAEEAAKSRLFPGIAFRGPEPRRAWVLGTGLDVWEIAELHGDYEGDVSALVENHGSLSERVVRLALAYAERFPEEIEERLRENRPSLEEFRERYPFIEVQPLEE
jgi:uncharacterized protein (DUF433 family)